MNDGSAPRRGGYRGRGRGGNRGGGRGNYGYGDDDRGGGNRGGGNRGRGRGYDPNNKIGYRALEGVSRDTPTAALMFCGKQSFLSLLQDSELKKDWVDLVLSTLNLALQDETLTAYKTDLMSFLLADGLPFLKEVCIGRFTDEINSSCGMRIDSLIRSLENYLQIFHRLCAMDTLVIKTLIQPVRSLKLMLLGAAVADTQLKSISDLYSQATKDMDEREREAADKENRERAMKRTGRVATNVRPDTDFREISVYPTEADMRTFVTLRKHREEGAFDDVDDYLDIQFRLLREDFVSTVRKGIKEFKDNPNLSGAKRFRSGDVKVYENLTILSPSFGRSGITYLIRIDMDNKMLKRHNWVSSKRLMYGSLLCLSQDCFEKTYLFATIAERKPEVMTKEGVFEIQFLPESQEKFDKLANHDAPFMAVESMAYFEAYYHVLNGMKHLNSGNFPLSQYIVRVQRNISQPAYLRMHDKVVRLITKSGHVSEPVSVSDLSPHSYSYGSNYGSSYDRYSVSSAPTAEQLGFNSAQYEAFKMALTNEFVVIQGPPGTGKTYVGLKIAEALLYNFYNVPCGEEPEPLTCVAIAEKKHALGSSLAHEEERREKCPPQSLQQMLVVCYTNHALDQFLEGMLDFCPIEDMVRVGSRSNNKVLEACNIGKQRGRRSRNLFQAHMELKAKKEKFIEYNNLEQLKKWMELSKTSLLPHDTSGLFSGQDHFYSQMCHFASEVGSDGENPRNAIARWLQCDTATFAAESAAYTTKEDMAEDEMDEGETAEHVDIFGEAERENEIRMGEEDDENYDFLKKIRAKKLSQRGESDGERDNDGFRTVKLTRQQIWKYRKHVEVQLSSKEGMDEEEVDRLNVLITSKGYSITKNLPISYRWKLYRYLVKRFQLLLSAQFKQLQSVYTSIVRLGDDLRKQEDIDTLRKAKVIGMTTTGAARMQGVLQQVGPEIVVVEEAAEVLEAHIITALSKHCKHLILIGDHKQLKPNPTVYELARDYHLDLSLFERMVKNRLPVKTLNIQHRMRPEVSKYIRGHVYDELHDHSSVLNREHIEGVDKSVFFFNHDHLESSDDQIMSHSNEFEADMVVGLTRYLLRQKSYEAKDITIITMYTGQLLLIRRRMPKAEFQGVKITSVDNFQGEENKIMIISMVRSNEKDKLGFIEIENRVCVSLSRAQYGMYVFANFDMLSRKSNLWRNLVSEAKKAGEFGESLSLCCRRHRNPCKIEKAEDFKSKTPTGGCTRICNRALNCGHVCKMTCHSRDLTHELYRCTEPCPKLHPNCAHKCKRMCHQDCGKCPEMVRHVLPCKHTRLVECHMVHDPEADIPCYEPCADTLVCGHKCTERCSQRCTTLCMEKVERVCSHCQELKSLTCHEASQSLTSYTSSSLHYNYKCDTPCETELICGHKCSGGCYTCSVDGHKKCTQTCEKMLKCGHRCSKTCHDCTTNRECGACLARCPYVCSHKAECRMICGQACEFHKPAKSCNWGCEHSRCTKCCGEPCNHTPCDKRCEKINKCGRKACGLRYQCACLCGETCLNICPKCDLPKRSTTFQTCLDSRAPTAFSVEITSMTLWIQLKDCNHTVPVGYMDGLVYSSAAYSTVSCPYKKCGKPVWNTPRYVTRTRRPLESSATPTSSPDLVGQSTSSTSAATPALIAARVAPALSAASSISTTHLDLHKITEQLKDHRLRHDVSASVYKQQLTASQFEEEEQLELQTEEYSYDQWA